MAGQTLEVSVSAATQQAQAEGLLNLLQLELESTRKENKSQSYLSKGLDFLYKGDEISQIKLELKEKRIQEHINQGNFDAVAKMRDEVHQSIESNQKRRDTQNNVSFYGGTALKIGALFYGGPIGWAATAGFYAADAAHMNDDISKQILDAGLGATKGLAYKGLVTGVMDSRLPLPAKGLAMSLGGRGLDVALTSDSYINPQTGRFSFSTGLMNTGKELTNLNHLAVDAAVMTVGFGLGYGLQRSLGATISNSPLYSRIATSGMAGVSRGSIGEMAAMRAAGESFSFQRVASKGLLMGTVYALAAVPGALQADHQYHQQHKQEGSQLQQGDGKTDVQFAEYKKVGTVKAVQLKQAATWTTSKGETMQAAAGDWQLTGSDDSVWSVKPDIFQQTYGPVAGQEGVYAKTAITRASQLTKPTTVQTLEGQGSGVAGDYLVRGPKGEQYIVPKAKFESMYQQIKPEGN
jgi:hypothetical protein